MSENKLNVGQFEQLTEFVSMWDSFKGLNPLLILAIVNNRERVKNICIVFIQ